MQASVAIVNPAVLLAPRHGRWTSSPGVFGVLKIPLSGSMDDYLWADERFVCTAASEAVQGHLTGRHHVAFQSQDEGMVKAFHEVALAHGGKATALPARVRIILVIARCLFCTQTATTSRPLPRTRATQCAVSKCHVLTNRTLLRIVDLSIREELS